MVNISKFKLQLVKEDSSRYNINKVVMCPSDLYTSFNIIFNMDEQAEEVMVMLCFDTKLKIIGAFEVSRGSLSASIVHPREVLKRALLCNAHSFALCHNHPSGDATPSKEDKDITKRIKEAGDIMGIKLIDHVIIGDIKYVSLKEDYNII